MSDSRLAAPFRTVVIIGAGQAGFQCAASLREQGWPGRIVMVGDEQDPPYNRPPLSKEYLNGAADVDVPLRPKSFYDRNGIELIMGTSAVAIDRRSQVVELSSGSSLPYDELVLATGADPRRPAEDEARLTGVTVLRSRTDADSLREQLDHCRSLVIVGGGFIGTEVAAVAASRTNVTILERAPRILNRVLSTAVAEHAQRLHSAQGVDVRTSVTVAGLIGDGRRVQGVALDDGTVIDADVVLYAVGATPRIRLAAAAGIEVGNGIIVDQELQSSDPHISAIGDCSNFPSPFIDGRVRLESVQNAADQARHVALRIARASDAPYGAVPWFWTHQHADRIQIAGLARDSDASVLIEGARIGSFSVYRLRDDAVVAVESVNAPRDHMRARKMLASGFAPIGAFVN